MTSRSRSSLRNALFLGATLAVCLAPYPCPGVTVLFSEDFEAVPLGTSPTYGLPGAWSDDPPPFWNIENDLPGLSDPQLGVREFEGWNFWRKQFWQDDLVTGGGPTGGNSGVNRRERFQRGFGTVAVADPDTWNDQGNPAALGLFNSFLTTPRIDLSSVPDRTERLVFSFDTSWRGGCCDPFSDLPNNQTAIVRIRVDNGPFQEVFRWESAPFRDGQGRPTRQPFDPSGAPNNPNPRFVPRDFDDRIFIDLTDLLTPPQLARIGTPDFAASSAGTGGGVEVEFVIADAGDDGWWAVDNVAMSAVPSAIPGDLHIDEVLDAKDIDAFAFGLLDEEGYADAWAGESPAFRGNEPGTGDFDFDDIPYFLNLMEMAGVTSAPAMLQAALIGIPEPATATIALLAACCAATRRRGRR